MNESMSDGKAKAIGIAIGGLVIVLCLVDIVVLRGERVESATVRYHADEPAVLEISRPYETHLIEVKTRHRVRGEYRGKAISIRLEDPEGQVLYETSELVARERRNFDFYPVDAGEHKLYVGETMTILGSGRGSAQVTVYVNDRRILGRLFGL